MLVIALFVARKMVMEVPKTHHPANSAEHRIYINQYAMYVDGPTQDWFIKATLDPDKYPVDRILDEPRVIETKIGKNASGTVLGGKK
jgi:5-deoxy-D-glucuronate isomerase